jgi:Flp pilus assembly protein TadG
VTPRRSRGPGRRDADRGSLALEYVIVAPLFLIVFALIFAYARVGQLNGTLDAATRDAARQVTQLPDLGDAQAVATATVQQELGSGSGGCNRGDVTVGVDAVSPTGANDGAQPQPGDTVTVTATCSYTLSDLGLPFPMPSMRATSQFSSVVDPNRSVG